MAEPQRAEVTQLLRDGHNSDKAALNHLIPLSYEVSSALAWTIRREWAKAKAWLYRELGSGGKG